MTKQEFVRANHVDQMPYLVQVLAGRLYDAAFEAGKAEGFRQGVDAVAIKEQEIHRAMYERGAQDATHRGSAAFVVAACIVLRRLHKFGKLRLNRIVDQIAEELMCMLDPAEAVRLVRSWGVHVEYDDELAGEIADLEGIA